MPVYSHSRLNAFENCALQYKYRYIDRIRTGWQSIEAFMGKCVHEVLEEVYRKLPAAKAEGPEPLVDRFNEIWDSKLNDNIQVVRPDLDKDYYRRAGAQCIRNYWERNYPFAVDPAKIIGVEMRVEMALDPDRRFRMMGFIDRVQHAEPGVIEIHDYKTSASLPREGSLRFDRQLPLYEIGIRQRFPQTNKVRLIWHYVAHGKEFAEEKSMRDLDRVKRDCISMIRTVEKAADFPAKKGPLCPWCEYQDRCPEWEGSKPVASPAFPAGRPAAMERAAAAQDSPVRPEKSPGPAGKGEPQPAPAPATGDKAAPRSKPKQLRLF